MNERLAPREHAGCPTQLLARSAPEFEPAQLGRFAWGAETSVIARLARSWASLSGHDQIEKDALANLKNRIRELEPMRRFPKEPFAHYPDKNAPRNLRAMTLLCVTPKKIQNHSCCGGSRRSRSKHDTTGSNFSPARLGFAERSAARSASESLAETSQYPGQFKSGK
jgi:hypothetical protein